MNIPQISELIEDVKRPVRNLAFRIGIMRQKSNDELIAARGPIVLYYGNQFDLSHPRCNALIGGSIIKGSYERMELKMIREFVRPTDRVIELGACMGVTSLFLFDLVGRGSHLVIEADRRNLDLARHMFDLNGKDVRINFGILASGDAIKTEIAFASNVNASSSSVYDREGCETSEQVPTIRFERIIEDERATVLVLDIEGGEYELFTNASSFGSIQRILLEAHPDIIGETKMREMLASLKAHGFAPILDYENSRFLILERAL